jgi:hypothetical protein
VRFDVNLRNVYAHTDPRRLWIAEWDYHPNAEGHQLIADKLYTALRSRSGRIPLRGDKGSTQAAAEAHGVKTAMMTQKPAG